MDKTFPEAIKGIRSAVMASEVREDIAQGMEYVEQFANTATTKAKEAAASAEAAAESASNAGTVISAAIDPTLTLSGKAADAAKVGEAINAESERAKGVEGELKEDIVGQEDRLFIKSKNIFDKSKLIDGFYSTANSETLNHTDNNNVKCLLQRINGGKTYTIGKVTYPCIFYDKNYNRVSNFVNESPSPVTFTAPINAKYMTVSIYNSQIDTIMIVEGDSYPQTYENFVDVSALDIALKNKMAEYHIGIGQQFTSLIDCLKSIQGDKHEKILYIHEGIYDIFKEMGGSSYSNNINNTVWRQWNAVVPPNTKIIGLGRVKLVYMPTSSDTTENASKVISVLNVSGSCHIENIDIECKNCRYAIHDETSDLDEFYGVEKVYKNVHIKRYDNDKSLMFGYGQAYGGGFSKSPILYFEDCSFWANSTPFSTHNYGNMKDGTGGTFTFKNCLFGSGGNFASMYFINFNENPPKTKVKIDGCNFSDTWAVRKIKNSTSPMAKNGYDITMMNCNDKPIYSDFDDDEYTPIIVNVIN